VAAAARRREAEAGDGVEVLFIASFVFVEKI
jgi:hypothetical protein